MRIVQVANFVHERSGGIRTALDAIGAHYTASGHSVMTIRPGQRYELVVDPSGRTFQASRRLHLHARLGRCRRGWPDP